MTTHQDLINEARQHLENIIVTTHPSRETMQKLGTLHQLATERAVQLDNEQTNIVKSNDLGEVIEIRPIPEELPEIKPRFKARATPAALTE